ncbi:hypothetical protein Z946_1360 [Sulfitobacter noctilucicola]|uniref:YnbE-like lipoprotein n=1 Tax=Sulfitobacter noctilucicola TaxID=1342301 RepID=A0A7W6Q2D5_9RHOB|nr:hypothetical protein [Sulfitobacter noctilucicola]KIN62500.1 hypothetical protein Z946_1360 [Sulfitobacter noctilucicola]MBB4172970.1 hypothetical protein [Sulfitobacter noctilucicola]
MNVPRALTFTLVALSVSSCGTVEAAANDVTRLEIDLLTSQSVSLNAPSLTEEVAAIQSQQR